MADIDRLRVSGYGDLPMRVIKKTPFANYIPQTFGLIVRAADTGKWLLIQRRHSIGLLSVLKGNFSLSNLPILFKSMTAHEVSMLSRGYQTRDTFIDLLTEVYRDTNHRYVDLTWSRLESGRELITKLIDKYRNTTVQLQWLWSKGFKRNSCYKEESMAAAMREFKEESGIRDVGPHMVSFDSISYEQAGLMGQTYTTRCWVMIVANELSLPPVTEKEIEVADRAWFSDDEVLERLDPELHTVFGKAQKIALSTLQVAK